MLGSHPARLVAVALALAACTSQATRPPEPSNAPTASPVAISMANARRCPVTEPLGVALAGGTHGNRALRVGGLWPHGIIAVGANYIDRVGRVRMKFPWWRKVSGRLRITGRRLDAPAPTLRAHLPLGYGSTGIQASSVTFPTEVAGR